MRQLLGDWPSLRTYILLELQKTLRESIFGPGFGLCLPYSGPNSVDLERISSNFFAAISGNDLILCCLCFV